MRQLYILLFALWVILFLIFFFVAVTAGGDANAGKVENGYYYLANRGKYTEVSRVTYVVSAGLETAWTALGAFLSLSLFLFICSSLMKGGIVGWGIAMFLVALCLASFWVSFTSLCCILIAFGFM
jgi:uncharacterized membrane protein YciS (DUF1049 family)